MISQKLNNYNGPQVLYPFILLDNHLCELYHLCLEVYALYKVWAPPFYGQGILLSQAHYDQNRLRNKKYYFLSHWYDPDSNPKPFHLDSGVLLLKGNAQNQIWLIRFFVRKNNPCKACRRHVKKCSSKQHFL